MTGDAAIKYRSFRLLSFGVLAAVVLTGLLAAGLRPDEFVIFMIILGPWVYIPTLFLILYGVDLRADNSIEIRYLLRRRMQSTESVERIVSSNGFPPRRLTIAFRRGRIELRANDTALDLARAIVQRNANVETVGFTRQFDA